MLLNRGIASSATIVVLNWIEFNVPAVYREATLDTSTSRRATRNGVRSVLLSTGHGSQRSKAGRLSNPTAWLERGRAVPRLIATERLFAERADTTYGPLGNRKHSSSQQSIHF